MSNANILLGVNIDHIATLRLPLCFLRLNILQGCGRSFLLGDDDIHQRRGLRRVDAQLPYMRAQQARDACRVVMLYIVLIEPQQLNIALKEQYWRNNGFWVISDGDISNPNFRLATV